MHSRKPIWVAIILALVALPQIALGWWNDDWKFRKRLTIDVTAVSAAVSAGLTEISLPVRLDAGNFAYFSDVDKSGADLRFVASDDRTPLEYRLERIDTGAQLAVAWVKIPIAKLRAEHSYVWLYYSAAKATPAASNTVEDATIVGSYDFAETAGPNQVLAVFGPTGKEARVSAALTAGWHHIGVAVAERLALYVDGQEAQASSRRGSISMQRPCSAPRAPPMRSAVRSTRCGLLIPLGRQVGSVSNTSSGSTRTAPSGAVYCLVRPETRRSTSNSSRSSPRRGRRTGRRQAICRSPSTC
jgi:hypothetical protein